MPADLLRWFAAVAGLSMAVLSVAEAGPEEGDEPDTGGGLPVAYPEERYLPVWRKSPFLRETAPAPAQAVKSFARDYVLSGFVESADEVVVYLKNHKTGESHRLSSKGGNPELRLVSLAKDRDPARVVATVERGAERAAIGYDPAAFSQPASPGLGASVAQAGNAAVPANRAPAPESGAGPAPEGGDAAAQAAPYVNPAAERLRQQMETPGGAGQALSPSGATTAQNGAAAPTQPGAPGSLGRKRRTLPEPLVIDGEN